MKDVILKPSLVLFTFVKDYRTSFFLRLAPTLMLPTLRIFVNSVLTLSQLATFFPSFLGFLAIYRWDEAAPVFGRHHEKRFILDASYDFVIVGAGSAGSVLASRLSEVPEWKILVLEAGQEENILTDTPGVASTNQLSPYDWKLRTEPQTTACLAYEDQCCNLAQGKAVGGTSVLNYMLYVRGNRLDYDGWAAAGNPGWSYEEVLPYFIKAEDNKNLNYAATRYHGTGGYLTVSETSWQTPLGQVYLDAAAELGYKVGDRNGANQTGFMRPQGTIREGLRCSTAKAYLKPARGRSNLHVAEGATILKILFEPGTKKAVGVEVRRFGLNFKVFANKEVILSAGALKSPHLLMLSGIGPEMPLKSLGIPVVADLPMVGQNLQDHVGFGGLIFLLEKPFSLMTSEILTVSEALRFARDREGPLTTLGGVEALGWVKTKYADPNVNYPDIQFIITSGSVVSDGGLQMRRNYGIRDEIWQQYFRHLNNRHTLSIIPVLLKPESRGYVQLVSTNPFEPPKIYANYLTNLDDVKALVDGLKIALKMADTNAMKQVGASLPTMPFPGCEEHEFGSDNYWECVTRQVTFTFWHLVGTCQMGPNAISSVVNHELKVHGVEGLRVVDASVMPTVPNGNTNVPTIMVAEKAADLIKSTWL